MPLDMPASAQCSSGDCDHPKDVCLPHSTDSSGNRQTDVMSGVPSDMGRRNFHKLTSTMLGRHVKQNHYLNANTCVFEPDAKRRKYGSTRRRAQSRAQVYNKRKKLTDSNQLTNTPNIKANLPQVTCGTITSHIFSCSLYRLNCRPSKSESEYGNKLVTVPPDSIMFDHSEFERLNELYGPFDLDGAASMYDAQVPEYCSIDRPFEKENLQGKTVFLNPPFGKAKLMLSHFELQRQQSPLDTKAVIILPRWNSKSSKEYKPITDKYRLVHTYPSGTYLFHQPHEKGSYPLSPTPWPVDVFLADDTVELRQIQSYESAKLTEHLKSINLFNSKNKKFLKVLNPQS